MLSHSLQVTALGAGALSMAMHIRDRCFRVWARFVEKYRMLRALSVIFFLRILQRGVFVILNKTLFFFYSFFYSFSKPFFIRQAQLGL